MFLKTLKKTFIFLLTLFIIPSSIYAYSSYVIAGGDNIGIKLNAKGIVIVGLYKVGDIYPASEAGLEVGDIITSINDQDVSTIADMVDKINKVNVDNINIKYLRNSVENNTSLRIVKDNNISKTGLYVKDSISGIGTLTFIDPETKKFGALGHEITESETSTKLEIKGGKIYTSVVTGVEPSTNGTPGEKNARYNSTSVLGNIDENTTHGIFGTYTGTISTNKKYKVADPNVIKKGNAKILTVLKDQTVESFDINIIKINTNSNQTTKNLLFEVTDQKLLDQTGGIVQGMSGSPIIQDDYIIGAVTHVVVDNPARGYGIFITNMLDETEN